MKNALPLILLLCASCSQGAPTPPVQVDLTEVWRLSGFESPESVLYDPETGLIFVSNVNGEGAATDGNGYISRISLDGSMEVRFWAQGLNAPKGMALSGECLYVTDITEIICIDRSTGDILNRWSAPGAGFLNDAVADSDGRIYFSDSATGRIYVLETDQMVHVWAEDVALEAVNGLLVEDERLLAVTMAGRFVSISSDGNTIEVLGEGLGNGDMLTADGQGAYFASEWPGRLYHLQPDGSFTLLSDTRESGHFMNDGMVHEGLLIVPHWQPGEVSAHEVRFGR